jgi:hypothetical protein
MEVLVDICRQNCWTGTMHCAKPTNNLWYLETVVWGHCCQHLSKFCARVCKRFCKNRKILEIFEQVGTEQGNEARGLDFVAYRNRKIWVVEVKTGTHSELKQTRKQFAERVEREMGIKLLLFHVDLDNEIGYSVRLRGEIV